MTIDFPLLTNAIGWTLVHFLWQGAAITLCTAFLLQLSRNARAQTRYLIACLSLALCLFAPIWELLQRLQTTKISLDEQVVSGHLLESKTALSWIDAMQIWFQMHIDFIVITWATVVAILGLRLLLGIFWLRSYTNGKRGVSNAYWQQKTDQLAEHFQIAKPVLVRIVNELESPITIGWIRPMVLLPASLLTGMTPSYLEALIAHELAHISRFDYVVNFIQNLIEMVLFFHPAVWWISKKIRIERENIADDLAASMLGEPRRLALALQELEYIQFTTPQLAQAAHGGNLMLRIKRLVRPEAQSINWKTAVTVVGIATVCVGFAANAALPTISQSKQVNTQNQIVAIEERNELDAEFAMADLREPSLHDQISSSPAVPKVSKSKGSRGEDVIVPARINFMKKGCAPEYPRKALRAESQGVSSLEVHFSAIGRIDAVDIVKSSGHELLDDAVKSQLLSGKCTATPGTLNGKPQPTTTRVDYVWKLS
ncbi:TonB family protein [Undibacterium fentianense]|uniref:TonB family protein n=1 Tax=Undibacterium fentianense TaxID=2828728 RepID=A0A941DWK9_9BURK|nr:TonB family protein [Undibacterium fentianense]MBR7798669.1 TonB family protein [Undibacterium fentianense]